MKRLLLSIAIVALATIGCRSLPFPDPHLEGEYGKSLKRWTRTVALYSGLETRAFVRIVYLSPEFVFAQAQQLSKMRAELPDQAAETLARMREEYRQPSFFAIASRAARSPTDGTGPIWGWAIAPNSGRGGRARDRLVRIERPFSPGRRALSPPPDEYSTANVLRFPDPPPPQME